MSIFPNRTTFMNIGPFSIQWYAVLILTGAFIAYYFSKRNLKSYRNVDVNGFFDDLFIWMLWFGIIGVRLWFCIFYNFEYYISHPLDIIRIWDGGLAFHGGFVGGALTMLYMCRKRNVSFVKVLDALAPTVLVAQAIGRWGNFINQECHGSAVSEDYFVGPLKLIKEGMHIGGVYYKPLFLYESLLCLLGFIIINFFLKKTQRKRGELIGAYMIWYGVIRFFIEGDRTDSLLIGSLKTAQVTSIAFVLIGLLLYFGIWDRVFGNRKPTIVFDLDGTLQDSNQAILDSFKETFEKYGDVKDFTEEKQLKVFGPPIKDMFEEFFPDLDADELVAYYRKLNAQKLQETLKPNEHALEVVSALRNEGYQLGILTTRARESVEMCLKKCGFKDDDFVSVITHDDVEKSKPDPEGLFKLINGRKLNSADVIVIGDSSADIKCGQNYGAYTVAYSVIEGKRPEIEAAGPNRIITDLRELLDIVKEDHYFTYNLK